MSDQSPHYGQPGGSQFPITTALVFPDHEIEHSLGMVFGVVVRSMGVARNIGAGFKALAGGEGIISMRFDSSEVGNTLTEIVAYGTVVTFRKSA